MNDNSSSLGNATTQGTAGDRIRRIADQLKQETSLQIKATSRILGAAAQISENHDRLIDEVVEIVEEDLEQQAQQQDIAVFTVEQLKQQFKTLKQAKDHFGVKASTWAMLVDKLNQRTSSRSNPVEVPISQRLDTIEGELKALRTDVTQALNMLALILEKVS
jgi:hypothetical protein